MKIQAIYKIKHRDEVREFETPEEAQAEWERIYRQGQKDYRHCNMSTVCTVPMYLQSDIVMYNSQFCDYTFYELRTEFRRVA